MRDTLPGGLTLARQQPLPHGAFPGPVLSEEGTRRGTSAGARRAHAAGLEPAMRLDTWDESAGARYDHTPLSELTSLRFIDGADGVLPSGSGRDWLTLRISPIGCVEQSRLVEFYVDTQAFSASAVDVYCL